MCSFPLRYSFLTVSLQLRNEFIPSNYVRIFAGYQYQVKKQEVRYVAIHVQVLLALWR